MTTHAQIAHIASRSHHSKKIKIILQAENDFKPCRGKFYFVFILLLKRQGSIKFLQLDFLPYPYYLKSWFSSPNIQSAFPSSSHLDMVPNSLNIIRKMKMLPLSLFSLLRNKELYTPLHCKKKSIIQKISFHILWVTGRVYFPGLNILTHYWNIYV